LAVDCLPCLKEKGEEIIYISLGERKEKAISKDFLMSPLHSIRIQSILPSLLDVQSLIFPSFFLSSTTPSCPFRI